MPSERCGAERRDGKPCTQWAMPNGRCRLHGGKTPNGSASANFKHGLFSGAIPDDIRESLRERATDPNIIANTESLAVMDWRLSNVLAAMHEHGLPEYNAMGRVRDEIKEAQATGNHSSVDDGLASLWGLIDEGIAAENAWAAFERTAKTRANISETERRRIRDAMDAITRKEFIDFITGFHNFYLSLITDLDDLDRVDEYIDRMGLPIGAQAD